MSSNLRRYLKKNRKKLQQLSNVCFRVPERERPPKDNLAEFVDVEDRNWKGRERTSIRARPADLAMLAEIAEMMTQRGWMVWNFLEAGGKTIAGQFAVCINRKLNLVKIGFDDDFRFCSPGNLLMEKVIVQAIDSGAIEEVNMMADLAWHEKWQTVSRPLYNAVVYPRSALIRALARLGLLRAVHRGLGI